VKDTPGEASRPTNGREEVGRSSGRGGAAEPPNIVIVLADDMGMGDTSVYQDWSGNPAAEQLHTPALERLARMGVRCTDAHAPHSRCTTSRYALLTGRYCWRTS
jgi:arylsulfatase A